MPVTDDERAEYKAFVSKVMVDLGCFDYDGDHILWHYTTGQSFIEIINSGSLWSTHISCLNDSTEIRYWGETLWNAVRSLKGTTVAAKKFLEKLVPADSDLESANFREYLNSDWFVSCFSSERDDLSQWRAYSGGENGYALGFRAGGLRGPGHLVKVNYDRKSHIEMCSEIAAKTITFYEDGLKQRNGKDTEDMWFFEFSFEWDRHIDLLSPAIKHPSFAGEKEYRIIYQLKAGEQKNLEFKQRASLMSRHLPLKFLTTETPEIDTPALPLEAVLIGPHRHKEVASMSANFLLLKANYRWGIVQQSSIPFQLT